MAPSSSPLPERLRGPLLAAGGHLGLALLATLPMVASPASRLVGHPEVDVWNHAWGPWWFWTRLSGGHLPLQTDLLAAPIGGRLWFPDALGALVGAPLVPLFGVVLAWNLVVLFHVGLASVAGRTLARAVGAGPGASWLGAAALACSPYLLSEVHNGISEAMAVGPPVLALALLLSALDRGGLGRWLGVGLFGGLTLAGTAYYSLGLATVAVLPVLAGLARARGRRGALLGGLLLAAAVAALIGLPALRAALWTMEQDPLVFRPPVRSLADLEPQLRHNAVDPRTFLWPGDFQSVDLSPEAFLHSSYLGWLALALALRSRAWTLLLAALAGLLLSLGPWLWFDGDWVLSGGARLALPYRALFELLPGSALGHPQRVGLPAIALFAALAARGLGGLGPRLGSAVGVAVVAELLLLSPAPWPLARTPVFAPAPADLVAEQAATGPRGIVLDLPADVGVSMLASRHLLYQARHGQPVPYKPDVRAATASLGGLSTFRWLTGLGEEEPARPADELARAGVRWVVLHLDLASPEEAARLREALTTWLGAPVEAGQALVFTVPGARLPGPR